MQPKTIKRVLEKKFNDWVSSIKDSEVVEAIRVDAICSGGSISSMLMGEEVNDYDFYFRTADTARKVAEYYVAEFLRDHSGWDIQVVHDGDRVKIVVQSIGVVGDDGDDNIDDDDIEREFTDSTSAKSDTKSKTRYRPVFITSNAITLSDGIQVVVRFYGEIDKIHENFDFIHCTCSWDAATGKLEIPKDAVISMLNRRLKYKGSKYPLCSIIRTRKFIKRNWHIDAGQYVKMAFELNKLDLTDPLVLEDQMVGVDVTYFNQVIALLNEDPGDVIDQTYLFEIIDSIFG